MGELDPWIILDHVLRDYFICLHEYNYVYDEIEQMDKEWKFGVKN